MHLRHFQALKFINHCVLEILEHALLLMSMFFLFYFDLSLLNQVDCWMSLLSLELNWCESEHVNKGEFLSHQKSSEMLPTPSDSYFHGFNIQTCSCIFINMLSGILFICRSKNVLWKMKKKLIIVNVSVRFKNRIYFTLENAVIKILT